MAEIKEDMSDKKLEEITSKAQSHFLEGFHIASQNRHKIKEAEENLTKLTNEARELLKNSPEQFQAKMAEARKAKSAMPHHLKGENFLHKLALNEFIISFRLRKEFIQKISDIILDALKEECKDYELYVAFCNETYTKARSLSKVGFEYLLKAEKIILEHGDKITSIHKGHTYHNLGVHYKEHDTLKSIPYFETSLVFLDNDRDTIENLIIAYIQTNNTAKYQEMVSKHPDIKFQFISQLSFLARNKKLFNEALGKPEIKKDWEELKSKFFNEGSFINLLDNCMIEEAFCNKDAQGICKIALKMISLYPLLIQESLTKALDKILDLGELKLAETLLDEAEKLFPNYEKQSIFILNLGYEKLVLHIKLGNIDNAESYFKKILEYKEKYPESLSAKALSHLSAKKLLEVHIEDKNYKSAKSYLEYVRDEDRENLDKYLVKLEKANNFKVISSIAKYLLWELLQEIAEESLKEKSSETSREVELAEEMAPLKEVNNTLPEKVEILAYMLDTNQIDIDLLDPRYIEAYFKYKKAVSANQSISDTLENINKWYSKYGLHQLGANNDIVKLKMPHYYAMISPDLNLEPSLKKKFEAALETGRIASVTNETGIKFCNGRFIELKIFGSSGAGDHRLYTNKLCLNENGDYLIIFNKEGKHKDALKSNSIEIYHSMQNGNIEHTQEMEATSSAAELSQHPSCEDLHEVQSYYTDILGSDWLQSISSNESE